MTDLHWLPDKADWADRVKSAAATSSDANWRLLVAAAGSRLDSTQTERLDRMIKRLCGSEPPAGIAAPPIRLALLGSCTVSHLAPGIRAAAARRNLWADIYTASYGQYLQELADENSGLHGFRPNAIAFSLDARHVLTGLAGAPADGNVVGAALDRLEQAWTMALQMGAETYQQNLLPVFPALLGSNEHRLTSSDNWRVQEFNYHLCRRADSAGVDVIDLGTASVSGGLSGWYDSSLWLRAKQEIRPQASPLFGETIVRLLAARRGRSAKCLVLDLDNTVWGGVIGDDGLDGIVLGQGSPVGEAHLALQSYAKNLSRRGIILAVCSKNDEAVAMSAFDRHPEMLLKKDDIACFIANWKDKATNIRAIAAQINIGLDSLVFVDDNPFERNLVRRELPMVMVPELPDDPAGYVAAVADAGYFEAVTLTGDDIQRAAQYQENLKRQRLQVSATDMGSYLQSLDMKLIWHPFDSVGLARIVQLINKSNQFNLTTRRYSSAEALDVTQDETAIALQLRLTDAFGDNGMISVIVARLSDEPGAMEIDTWLMSCRVLGRGVEEASMNLLARLAAQRDIRTLFGRYLPTSKNSMVAGHYGKLGFSLISTGEDGSTLWRLDLARYAPFTSFIQTIGPK